MIRTQIQLTDEQARILRKLAHEEGVSMAELIRRAIDRMVEDDEEGERWRRATAVIGRFRGGPADLSVRHDDYLAEDYLS